MAKGQNELHSANSINLAMGNSSNKNIKTIKVDNIVSKTANKVNQACNF